MGNGRKPLSPSLDRKIINFPGDVCHEKNKKEGSIVKKKRKTVSYKKHQERKRNIAGKKVIGIDPAKEKHQVTVLDEMGIQIGESFSITVSHKGFSGDLCAVVHNCVYNRPSG
jgi:hypothetical protein